MSQEDLHRKCMIMPINFSQINYVEAIIPSQFIQCTQLNKILS